MLGTIIGWIFLSPFIVIGAAAWCALVLILLAALEQMTGWRLRKVAW